MIDKFINLFAKRFKFLLYLKEYIENKSYRKVNIDNNKISFFIPNKAVDLRVKKLFTKEPGTMEWINSFTNDENISTENYIFEKL